MNQISKIATTELPAVAATSKKSQAPIALAWFRRKVDQR
jgi:hypothetical protein